MPEKAILAAVVLFVGLALDARANGKTFNLNVLNPTQLKSPPARTSKTSG